jgi:hypothetical protein
VGELSGSFTQKETYIYAKRTLTELPQATLGDPVISGAAFFRATALVQGAHHQLMTANREIGGAATAESEKEVKQAAREARKQQEQLVKEEANAERIAEMKRCFFRTTPLVSADHSPGASARSSHHGGEQGERAGGGGGDESHPRQCKQPTWRRGGRTCMRGRGCSWRRGRQVLSCAHSLLPCSPSTHVLMLLGLLWHRGWPTTNRDRAAGHAQIATMWRIQLAPNHVCLSLSLSL